MDSQILFLITIIGLLLVIGEGRAPALHRVGGDRFGWRLNVSFSNWSSNQNFYVGDWLYFGFDKHKFSVLEVNRTGYDNCIANNFKSNVTRGGRDVFNLTVARPYYFIDGRGHCIDGVKLAINVLDSPPDSPSLLKSSNVATSGYGSTSVITNMYIFIHMFIVLLVEIC